MTISFLSGSQLMLLMVFILLVLAQPSSAFYIQDPIVFKPSLSPGYITVGTGYYEGPNDVDWMVDANYLHLNETMMFNSSANVTLSSITHASNYLTLTAYGGGGTLNFSANLTNTSTKFFYKFDGAFSQTLTSNSTGWISGSQIISGTHDLSFSTRNVTFTDASLSPSSAPVFSSFVISVNLNDNDGGTISSATAQVQKPGGTQNYTMTHGVGNLWSLSFADSGTTGVYTVISFNATDSSGANFSIGSALGFRTTSSPAGGTSGRGEPGGGGSTPAQEQNQTVPAGTTPIPVSSPVRQGAQIGGLVWWLALSLGSIMSVLSLSSRSASSNLLIVGLILVAYSAYQLQLIPPVTLRLAP